METMSIIGIVLGLSFMIFLAFKGISIYIYGPLSAAIVILTGGMPFWSSLTGVYMDGFVGYIKNFFLLLMLSAIFAKIMGDSGAAQVIAMTIAKLAKKSKKHKELVAIFSIHAIVLLLTYGGISLFVVTFLIVSIAKTTYQELDIPWHLERAGSWATGTVTMSMLPGSPAAQNLLPIPYLGTTPSAAPIIGLSCAILCAALEITYVTHAWRKTKKRGEGFLPTGAAIARRDITVELKNTDITIFKALTPSVVLIFVLNFLPIPSVLVALLVAIAVATVLFWKNLPNIFGSFAAGAEQSIGVTVGVASVVGFGAVVSATPGYAMIIESLDKIPGSPLMKLIIAVNVCAGVAGSASGGLAIGLNSFAQKFMDMGINPQLIHRISLISSGGLDSLPHSGAVISGLRVSALTHKQAYKHVFITNTVIPIIVSIFALVLASAGIC